MEVEGGPVLPPPFLAAAAVVQDAGLRVAAGDLAAARGERHGAPGAHHAGAGPGGRRLEPRRHLLLVGEAPGLQHLAA